ncbi:hypothetical protein [Runella slithyformis]|uniref:hypothetical protein n=1 Tax=Runella slithyformis TaxID=106 RepID=UPI00146A3B4A|nr:hypothetical protein [Runella slithyformis]
MNDRHSLRYGSPLRQANASRLTNYGVHDTYVYGQSKPLPFSGLARPLVSRG